MNQETHQDNLEKFAQLLGESIDDPFAVCLLASELVRGCVLLINENTAAHTTLLALDAMLTSTLHAWVEEADRDGEDVMRARVFAPSRK